MTAVRRVVEEQWAGDLIASWWDHGWLDLTLTVGDELAPLIGARPGEVAVHESTTVGIFQLINVALDLDPAAPSDRRRRPRLPDRPVRRRGGRPPARWRAPPRDRRPRRRRRGDPVDGRLPDRRDRRRGRGDRAGGGGRSHDDLGPVARGRCARRRPARASASTSPSAAPTSSSTVGRARRRSCTSRTTCTTGSSSRSGDGSVNPTSSPWSVRSRRGPGSAGCSTARRPCSDSSPHGRGSRLTAERRHRRDRGEGRDAHRPRPRPRG